MPKFFIDANDIKNGNVIITGEDYNHITKVHRMKVGESIIACDGKGLDLQCEIREINKSEVVLDIIESLKCDAEPKTKVILFQGQPKQGKMETIIQKNTELGILSIVPVQMHRSVVKMDKDDKKKLERWQRVALEASKQCGRGCVPTIEQPISFKEAIDRMASMQYAIMPYENESEQKLYDVLASDVYEIGILVGPEGGFEKSEVEYALSKGIKSVTLGKRILRTETVGAALLPIILYHIKDF